MPHPPIESRRTWGNAPDARDIQSRKNEAESDRQEDGPVAAIEKGEELSEINEERKRKRALNSLSEQNLSPRELLANVRENLLKMTDFLRFGRNDDKRILFRRSSDERAVDRGELQLLKSSGKRRCDFRQKPRVPVPGLLQICAVSRKKKTPTFSEKKTTKKQILTLKDLLSKPRDKNLR